MSSFKLLQKKLWQYDLWPTCMVRDILGAAGYPVSGVEAQRSLKSTIPANPIWMS